MTVDKFGGRETDDRSGVSLNFINNSFVRRDGGSTVTGSTGSTLNNVVFPTSERDKQRKLTSIQTMQHTKFPNLGIL